MSPDESILMAIDKARTGANAHDIGVWVNIYENYCKKGREDKVKLCESAFNAFLSGRVTPFRKAIADAFYGGKPPVYPNSNYWNCGG